MTLFFSIKSLFTYIKINGMLLLTTIIQQYIPSNISQTLVFFTSRNIFYINLTNHFVDNDNKKNNNIMITKNHNDKTNNLLNIYYFVFGFIFETTSFLTIKKLLNIQYDNNYLQTLILFIPISFIVEIIFDFFHYWSHRFIHNNNVLYKYIHKTHHKHISITPIITYYQNPLDFIITNFIPYYLSLFIVKNLIKININFFMYCLLTNYKDYIEVVGHAVIKNTKTCSFPQFIWLPKFFNIQLQSIDHNNHHIYPNKNFSKRFSLWDKIFGTWS
jgi:sterol desaturase/sphingolipid hydroxylase (fatty acid hydroxylase superfamily)